MHFRMHRSFARDAQAGKLQEAETRYEQLLSKIEAARLQKQALSSSLPEHLQNRMPAECGGKLQGNNKDSMGTTLRQWLHFQLLGTRAGSGRLSRIYCGVAVLQVFSSRFVCL